MSGPNTEGGMPWIARDGIPAARDQGPAMVFMSTPQFDAFKEFAKEMSWHLVPVGGRGHLVDLLAPQTYIVVEPQEQDIPDSNPDAYMALVRMFGPAASDLSMARLRAFREAAERLSPQAMLEIIGAFQDRLAAEISGRDFLPPIPKEDGDDAGA